MGKPKKKKNKAGAKVKSKKKDESLNGLNFSVDDLLEKVEEYIESFNFELAEKFCDRALEMSPDNLQALNMAASVYLEIGKNDEAVNCLQHAIEIEPEKGFSKYMTLGELLEGEEAVKCLKKGVELMIAEKESGEKENVSNSDSGAEKVEILDRDISNALCSLAEIYLTDCCFAANAETTCRLYCEKAIEHDPNNPEAYQVMANFLLSEQKSEEAKETLLKGFNLWHGCDDPTLKSARMPSYESRISLSKMLIEVNELDNACSVLEELLSEDDEIVQVWYLLGWIQYLKEQDYNLVVYYLEMAQKLFIQTGCDDEPLLEHIDELLSEVKVKTNNDSVEQDDNNDTDDDDDDELNSMDTTA
ncbi:probable assembly chaperone of rpl4 [Dendronephthya gigantea]|uniref:probable assembly chaperone of rpl4 n=1 Tax=Dendronephthya gigantea TaxID=151771 RepID=UPI00106DA6CB|nr:probable assembly chaperone of rpl4 [Dendronephthya gigantea]